MGFELLALASTLVSVGSSWWFRDPVPPGMLRVSLPVTHVDTACFVRPGDAVDVNRGLETLLEAVVVREVRSRGQEAQVTVFVTDEVAAQIADPEVRGDLHLELRSDLLPARPRLPCQIGEHRPPNPVARHGECREFGFTSAGETKTLLVDKTGRLCS